MTGALEFVVRAAHQPTHAPIPLRAYEMGDQDLH
jgi:hypothetical protein